MATKPSIRPTTPGGGPHDTVRAPIRTGEPRSEARVGPGSMQTSSAQSVRAPRRPPFRFFSPGVRPNLRSRGSTRMYAPAHLPRALCGLYIGVVILLEDEPAGEQRPRRLSDQLHVGVMAGVPRGKLLGREGREGPAYPREQVESFQKVRIEPPVHPQRGAHTLAASQHGGHMGEPQARLDVAIGVGRELERALAIHAPLDITRIRRRCPGDVPLDEVAEHGLEDRPKAYGVLPRRPSQPHINDIRWNVGDPRQLVLAIAGGLVAGQVAPANAPARLCANDRLCLDR